MAELVQNADFLQRLIDSIPSLLFIVDPDVRIVHLNLAASKVLGLRKETTLLRRGGDVLHCIYANESPLGCGHAQRCTDCIIRNSVGRAYTDDAIYADTAAMRLRREERIEDVSFRVTTNAMTYGGERYVILVMEDITRQKAVEDALRASESRLHLIMSVMGEGVFALDLEGRLTFMNPEAERMLGWSERELLGARVHDIVRCHAADGTPLSGDDCPMGRAARTGRPERIDEHHLTRKDGTTMPVSLTCNPITDHGTLTGSVVAFHDISQIKEAREQLQAANRQLERQATTDPLTGIYNRLKFDETLAKEISRAQRHRLSLSLVMFDIDHFKAINDTHGHHVGDAVLRQLTAHVSRTIRQHDHFARWGGEEFTILLTHIDGAAATQFAEKLREEIASMKPAGLPGITCSFGVTQLWPDDNIYALARRADDALYAAKNGGRNRVVTF